MSFDRRDFDEFFAAVNDGHRPFRWQRRLLDHVLDSGRWPAQIGAPTGSGKSNVVDVHVFVNALAAIGAAPRVPRRLCVVVNRRALVDSHHLRALSIAQRLAHDASGVLGEVRDALQSLRTSREWAVGERKAAPEAREKEPIEIAELRGGVAPERGWLDEPSACAVVAATPDMWGSRLLMRGYGSSRGAWPREAGLLAFDSVVVIDEAHLNRQLLLTAQRVAQLAIVAESPVPVPALQVVETTATPAEGSESTSVGVHESDLVAGADDSLGRRLLLPKQVRLAGSPAWPSKGKAAQAHVEFLAAQVTGLLATRHPTDRPVGCIVNRIDTAVRVAEALQTSGLRVATWVGRRRPVDVAELIESHPDLFSSSGDTESSLDVLVATQTVEVGVDIDLFALVTELASGSAIAQRAGRVNRVGRSDSATVVVVGPTSEAGIAEYLPYAEDDLRSAFAWIQRRQDASSGLAPWALSADPPPAETQRRPLFQRPEMYDAWWWSHTSESLFAPQDLSLFLRDDLESERATAGLVLRNFATIGVVDDQEDVDSSVLLSLVQMTPPDARETYPVPLGELRQIIERAAAEPDVLARSFVVRDKRVAALTNPPQPVLPGDVLVLPSIFRCTRAGVPSAEPVSSGTAPTTYWGADGVELAAEDWVQSLAGLDAEQAQITFEEGGGGADKQIILPPGSESADVLPWVVIKPKRVVLDDTEQLQESVLGDRVTLDQHRRNVEARARHLATDIGLSDELIDPITAAAFLHDEGKRDRRFQLRLGADPRSGVVLAKSGLRSSQQVRRNSAADGLRRGWRHEQLSAAIVCGEHPDLPNLDLVARLVGTSHGYGRGAFDHPSKELAADAIGAATAQASESLFGSDAGWETLIERTETHWGVWGCAFLEAILRAADCQISGEGS